jgi:DNA primase
MIPQAYIEELLLNADIVSIIGAEVSLIRSKANYYGRCPFHGERHPEQRSVSENTFSVSVAKRFFHCFACGAHGSVLGFLMKHKGLSFPDAVAVVAKEAGVAPPPNLSRPSPSPKIEFDAVAETLEIALKYYERALRSANPAIDLLKRAGISGLTAKHYRIGYAPAKWDNLIPLFGEQYVARCEAAGLAVVKDDRTKAYDRLRDRIIFPTLNGRDQVLGLAGLALADRTPEYLRTSRSPGGRGKKRAGPAIDLRSDDKASMFGLRQANISMHAKGFVVLVQDCLDVLRLYESGLHNVVAPAEAGKLRTESVARLFRRTPVIVCCFPRTKRGSNHAWLAMQAALPALTDEVQVRFAVLPDEMGPGDVLQQPDGKELFGLLLNSAIPLSEYFLQGLASQVDFRLIEGRAKVLSRASDLLAQITAPHLKSQLEEAVRELVDDRLELLDSVDEHDQWLANAIQTASVQLLIISPWVTRAGIGRFDLCSLIAKAVARGVKVDIYTDPEFNVKRRRQAAGEPVDDGAERALAAAGARVHQVTRIHSKIVAVDHASLCIGSFNWLSAAKTGNYQRHEVSLIYRQGNIRARIVNLQATIAARCTQPAVGERK